MADTSALFHAESLAITRAADRQLSVRTSLRHRKRGAVDLAIETPDQPYPHPARLRIVLSDSANLVPTGSLRLETGGILRTPRISIASSSDNDSAHAVVDGAEFSCAIVADCPRLMDRLLSLAHRRGIPTGLVMCQAVPVKGCYLALCAHVATDSKFSQVLLALHQQPLRLSPSLYGHAPLAKVHALVCAAATQFRLPLAGVPTSRVALDSRPMLARLGATVSPSFEELVCRASVDEQLATRPQRGLRPLLLAESSGEAALLAHADKSAMRSPCPTRSPRGRSRSNTVHLIDGDDAKKLIPRLERLPGDIIVCSWQLAARLPASGRPMLPTDPLAKDAEATLSALRAAPVRTNDPWPTPTIFPAKAWPQLTPGGLGALAQEHGMDSGGNAAAVSASGAATAARNIGLPVTLQAEGPDFTASEPGPQRGPLMSLAAVRQAFRDIVEQVRADRPDRRISALSIRPHDDPELSLSVWLFRTTATDLLWICSGGAHGTGLAWLWPVGCNDRHVDSETIDQLLLEAKIKGKGRHRLRRLLRRWLRQLAQLRQQTEFAWLQFELELSEQAARVTGGSGQLE